MHNYFMLAALEQAWLGRGVCAPNPSVGAVAVHQGEIIAKAWHRGVGTPHAERLVLEQIPTDVQDVTLYVTLEPCNHWGRTPPCVEAITPKKIKQVIYGFRDPNPTVRENNTPAILEAKGIKTVHFPLPEINSFYESYYYWTKTKKPWITIKLAQTLDGKIGIHGQRYQLSNPECAEFTHLNRLHTDVILTTAKTIRIDDPMLNVRLNGEERGKTLAIIDSYLTLPADAKIFHTAQHCHIFYYQSVTPKNYHANCSYHPMPSSGSLLDLSAVINHLGALGYHDVWVEAGATLFAALHQESLVQRTYLYIVPMLLGDKGIAAFNDKIFSKKAAVAWQIKANNAIACLNWQENECLLD